MTPHELLDAAMNDRRLEMRMTWSDLAKAAGTSDVTLRAIRRGDNQPSSLTKRRIEDAFQWSHGSIDAILTGGNPTPLEEKREFEPDIAELAERVAKIEARGADNRIEEVAELLAELQATVNKMLGIDSNKESGSA